MRAFIPIFGLFISTSTFTHADTIDHYMNILTNIPTMEMKADPESQAWARSAKNVLTITNESIAETLLEANRLAQLQGKPLFCLPENTPLNAIAMKTLIESAYQNTPTIQSEKAKLTVSQVAWMAVTHDYPCKGLTTTTPFNPITPSPMQHEER